MGDTHTQPPHPPTLRGAVSPPPAAAALRNDALGPLFLGGSEGSGDGFERGSAGQGVLPGGRVGRLLCGGDISALGTAGSAPGRLPLASPTDHPGV